MFTDSLTVPLRVWPLEGASGKEVDAGLLSGLTLPMFCVVTCRHCLQGPH